MPRVEGQPQGRGQLGHELGVRPRRLAVRPVIQMGHRESQARLRGQLVQETEQADTVPAAGHGHDPGRIQATLKPAQNPASMRTIPVIRSLAGGFGDGPVNSLVRWPSLTVD